jgi:hypothetical protein
MLEQAQRRQRKDDEDERKGDERRDGDEKGERGKMNYVCVTGTRGTKRRRGGETMRWWCGSDV